MRLHLITPRGTLVQPATYNKLFTDARHGDGLLFHDSFDSCGAREFLNSDDDRREGFGVSEIKFAELVHLYCWRTFHFVRDSCRRRGHRLDVLHSVQQHVCEYAGDCRGVGRFYYRI